MSGPFSGDNDAVAPPRARPAPVRPVPVAEQLVAAESELVAAREARDNRVEVTCSGSLRSKRRGQVLDKDLRDSVAARRRVVVAERAVGKLRAQVAAARFVPVPPEWLVGAELVRDRLMGWCRVARVNTRTVSVFADGATARLPVARIGAVACRMRQEEA